MTSSSKTELGSRGRDLSPAQLLEVLSYALVGVPPASSWPMTAAKWTAQGSDSDAVIQLAALSQSGPDHDVQEAMRRLLSDAGVPLPGDEASRFIQADLVAQLGASEPSLREQCCKLLDASYRKHYADRYQPALEALVLIGSNWDEPWGRELRESAAATFDTYLKSDQRQEALNAYAAKHR
jgi:hypothetical protein